MKIKEIIHKILYLITLILLFSMAYYVNNIFLRIVLVFIAAIIANLVIEVFNHLVFKKSELFLIINMIKTKPGKSQKTTDILTLFYIPIFQSISVIILSVFVHA